MNISIRAKQVFHINPDGSGKLALSLSCHHPTEKTDKEISTEQSEEAARRILGTFRGVEAWHDVNHRVVKNSNLEIIGTGHSARSALEI